MEANSVKARFSTSLRSFFAVCAALCAVTPEVQAQTLPGLSVQLYAGLTVSGAVGTVYQVQYITNLTQTTAWLPLTNLMLASNPQLWVDTTCPATGRRFYRTVVTNEVPAGMVLIPGGSFTMGDANDGNTYGDAPTHTVNVSALYADSNLVSYTLSASVYQWATSHGYSFDNAGSAKAFSHPVQSVNWYDVVKWCNARSEMGGLTPCYYTNASHSQITIYRSGQFDIATNWVNWVASGYRLPTEAEWEKAARGGVSGHRFPWSDGDTIDWSRANYCALPGSNSYDVNPGGGANPAWTSGGDPYTSPVGSFAPNGYGLYDMAGNVWEWCWEWYSGTYYFYAPGTDPRGPSSGPFRVFRGGAWNCNSESLRCAYRSYDNPHSAGGGMSSYGILGFRCVRGL